MPRLITKVLHANEFWVFLVIAALTLVIQARSGQFYTANNLVDLAGAMVVPGLFAVAAHLVLVSGGIDVSFPALASLAVYVTTKVLVDNGWNGPVIVPFLIAAALGALDAVPEGVSVETDTTLLARLVPGRDVYWVGTTGQMDTPPEYVVIDARSYAWGDQQVDAESWGSAAHPGHSYETVYAKQGFRVVRRTS